MNLKKQQWYVGWFFICLTIIDEFLDDYGHRKYKYYDGANLCTFMRVSLLWGPLIIALHIAIYSAAIASVTYLPVYLFGFDGYGWIIGAIIGVVAVIWLINALDNAWKDWLRQRRYDRQSAKVMAPTAPSETDYMEEIGHKGPSFISVLWDYAVAIKQRICPIINFN